MQAQTYSSAIDGSGRVDNIGGDNSTREKYSLSLPTVLYLFLTHFKGPRKASLYNRGGGRLSEDAKFRPSTTPSPRPFHHPIPRPHLLLMTYISAVWAEEINPVSLRVV